MPRFGGAFASDLDTAEWMDRRRRQIEQFGRDAEAAGRDTWDAATRTGQDLAAPTSGDVHALGRQVLAGRQGAYGQAGATAIGAPLQAGQPPLARPASSAPHPTVGYEQPESVPEMIKLRRQQAAFHEGEWAIDRQNRWMLIPALAPVAVGLLEGAGLLGTAEMAGPQGFLRTPLNLTGREPPLIRGDNWTTRAGRRAHVALKERIGPKLNWESEPPLEGPNGNILRPDVAAPARNRNIPGSRYQMELKPNTESGRRAAARAVRRYQSQTGNKTRAIYYDPKDLM